MESSDDNFEGIRKFFTKRAWQTLSDFEKQSYCNMKSNYEKMSDLGIAVKPPSFMKRPVADPSERFTGKATSKRQRATSPDDSGDEYSLTQLLPKRELSRRARREVDYAAEVDYGDRGSDDDGEDDAEDEGDEEDGSSELESSSDSGDDFDPSEYIKPPKERKPTPEPKVPKPRGRELSKRIRKEVNYAE